MLLNTRGPILRITDSRSRRRRSLRTDPISLTEPARHAALPNLAHADDAHVPITLAELDAISEGEP